MDPAPLAGGFLLWRALLAYVLLMAALVPHNGGLGPLAVAPFLIFLYLLLDTVRRRPTAPVTPRAAGLHPRQWVWLLVPLAVLGAVRPPGIYLRYGTPLWLFPLLTGAVLGLALLGLRDPLRTRQRDLIAAAMLGLVLLAGAWVLHASPSPLIDVFVLQQRGAAELLAGRDPYTAVYPNLYNAEDSLAFFGAPITELTNYPYPPLSLLVTTASHFLGGDVRLGFLGLHLMTGALLYAIARPRSSATALGILALHLLNPRGLFVLEQAWTEPLLSACVVAWVASSLHKRPPHRRALLGEVVFLALFLSAKQYSVLLLPLVLAPRFRPAWRATTLLKTTALAAGLAALLLLPFLLWHPRDFLTDVVLFQLRQPFRRDALSLPAIFHFVTGLRAPGALALLGAVASLVWAWKKLPRQHAGLLYGAALGFVGFFAMAKQAFCNYYSFAAVLLLLCAAACVAEAPRAAGIREAD